jgi:pimeloyl-ACP methyl ester carboxylesterase
MSTITRSTVTISGIPVFCAQVHKENLRDVPILFIHGNLGSSLWFSEVMDVGGRRAAALDMPNFGRSGDLGSCAVDAYGAFLAHFIREMGLEQAVLVGHSLGGAAAMDVAVNHPQLISGLFLIDSAPVSGLVTPETYYPVIDSYRTSRSLLEQALRAVVPALHDDQLFSQLVDDAQLMRGPCFVGHAEALGTADFRGRAHLFTRPVHAVCGEADVLITPEMTRTTAEAFHGTYEILPGVGHSVTVENPGLFLERFSLFLDALHDK